MPYLKEQSRQRKLYQGKASGVYEKKYGVADYQYCKNDSMQQCKQDLGDKKMNLNTHIFYHTSPL